MGMIELLTGKKTEDCTHEELEAVIMTGRLAREGEYSTATGERKKKAAKPKEPVITADDLAEFD